MIPRNLRVGGRGFVVPKRTFISTNFIVLETNDEKKALFYGAWSLTTYFQLMCEMASKSLAETRKTEIVDLEKTYWPSSELVENADVENLPLVLTIIRS